MRVKGMEKKTCLKQRDLIRHRQSRKTVSALEPQHWAEMAEKGGHNAIVARLAVLGGSYAIVMVVWLWLQYAASSTPL